MTIKSGICPQCGGDEIYTSIPNHKLRAKGHGILFFKNLFNFGFIFIQHYACKDCRYMETYVEDEESMNRISENWQPLKKEKRKNNEE